MDGLRKSDGYNQNVNMDDLKKMFLLIMKKYGIQSSIFTRLRMYRKHLIAKEKSKQAYEGKLKNVYEWIYEERSINNDLESFINNLQEISSQEEIKDENVWSFFLPKLTKEELKLVEEKNAEHMITYHNLNPDVDPEEMKKSDSKDKYVHSTCFRGSMVLNLDDTSSETLPRT